MAPFLLPGYFWGANDARHHVYFLFEYDRLVQDGIWWPRWSPDFAFGYGYPFFNIYGLFSHFLAELLHHFLGFSFTAAVEAIFGVSIVAGAGAMYLYVRSWLGRPAAMIAALAGSLFAIWLRYVGPSTTLGMELMMDILLIVVIGGMGTMYGAVVGTAIFVLAQNYLKELMGGLSEATASLPLIPDLLSPDRWLLWLGVLFILSVYFFPTGIVGRLRGTR